CTSKATIESTSIRCVLIRENLRQFQNPGKESRKGEKGSDSIPAEMGFAPFPRPGCRARLVIWYNFFCPLPITMSYELTSPPMPDAADARPSRRTVGPGAPGERPVPREKRKPAGAAPRAAQRRIRDVRLGSIASQIGYALRRAQLAVFADIIDALAEFDLSPAKFSVLAMIHENPGARPSEVGRALDIKKTNFVPLLDALEPRGLVARRPPAEDRRAV